MSKEGETRQGVDIQRHPSVAIDHTRIVQLQETYFRESFPFCCLVVVAVVVFHLFQGG